VRRDGILHVNFEIPPPPFLLSSSFTFFLAVFRVVRNY